MKKDITIEDIRNVEKFLLPCPFCGFQPQIIVCDDEGNIKRNPEEYLEDPWSGLSFALIHPIDEGHFCPVATDRDDDVVLGNYLYGSLDEIIENWNKRLTSPTVFLQLGEKTWFDDISAIYMRLNEEGKYIPMTFMFDSCFDSRLSYLKNIGFEEAVAKLREEWKDCFDIRFIFKNGDVNDYKI